MLPTVPLTGTLMPSSANVVGLLWLLHPAPVPFSSLAIWYTPFWYTLLMVTLVMRLPASRFSPTAKLMAVSAWRKGSDTAGEPVPPLYCVMGDVATIRSFWAVLSVLAVKLMVGTLPFTAFTLMPLAASATGNTA